MATYTYTCQQCRRVYSKFADALACHKAGVMSGLRLDTVVCEQPSPVVTVEQLREFMRAACDYGFAQCNDSITGFVDTDEREETIQELLDSSDLELEQ